MTINPNKYFQVEFGYRRIAVPRADIETLLNILTNSFDIVINYDPDVTYLSDEPIPFSVTPMPKLGEKQ